ncbi:hypothetical protein B0H13DRAFT_1869875 [Mycena leptocephala]|nr:hypothetical protein B0H13DRAFT_1869875 [Mycena leptocephala]
MWLVNFLVLLGFAGCGIATFPTQLVFQTGQSLENIAVRWSSQLLITSSVSPTLYTLDPTAANATLDEVYTFPNANCLLGIAEYRSDVYAIVASELNLTSLMATPGSVVIWSLDFTSGGHADRRRVNGLHFRAGLLYFTNTQLGTFSRMPSGGGAAEVLGFVGFDDFTFDSEGRAWVDTNPGFLTLFTRLKDGWWVQEILVSTVLNEPSSAAFGRDGASETKILYVTTRTGQIVAVDTSGAHA